MGKRREGEMVQMCDLRCRFLDQRILVFLHLLVFSPHVMFSMNNDVKSWYYFVAARRKKRKGNLAVPAVIMTGAMLITLIVGTTGLVAGKALALSFLALVMTIALSTRAVASNQRSTVVKGDIQEALADISDKLWTEGAVDDGLLPKDAIIYSSHTKRNG